MKIGNVVLATAGKEKGQLFVIVKLMINTLIYQMVKGLKQISLKKRALNISNYMAVKL